MFGTLSQRGIDSFIMLTSGGDNSSSEVFAYQAYGNASSYGGYTSAQATAVPLRSFSREGHMRVILIDSATGETAWLGDAKTEGQGMVNVTDSAFQSSLAAEVVEVLADSSHFP